MTQSFSWYAKSAIAFGLAFSVLFFGTAAVAATNSNAITIEDDDNQYLYIDDTSHTGLDITGDITLEAWVKLESLNNNGGIVLLQKGDTFSDAGYALILQNYGTDDYRIWGQFCQDGGCNTASQKTGANTNLYDHLGQWVHLAASWEAGSGNEVQVYVNGVEDGDGSVNQKNASYIRNNSNTFHIGTAHYNNSYNQKFDGIIDEVRIWDDVRTATEIADNYDVEISASASNLVGYWQFSGNIEDATSNNNDLTNVNCALYAADVPFVGSC